jgi:integrase
MSKNKKHKTFDQIYPEFLEMKRISINVNTFQGYLTITAVFSNWLKDKGFQNLPIRKISNRKMAKFFIYLVTVRDLDRPTCDKYRQGLKIMYRYFKKCGYVKYFPFDLISLPCKKEDKGAQVIPEEDCIRLLTLIKKRDFQLYVACMVQYYCFIRPGNELRLMRVSEINLERGVISIAAVRAKNRQEEPVTIPTQLIELLKEYGIDRADKEYYVFGKRGKPGLYPWSINMLTYRFNVYRDKLKLSKKFKFYSMKHTGAVALHNSGCPIRNEMDQLRHKNLSASQHYLKKHGGLVDDRIRNNFPELVLMCN